MNNYNFPQVNDVINGWEFECLTNKRKQELVNGIITYKDYYIKLKGVIQPLKPEDVALKPEEQRSWAWYQIHVKSSYTRLLNDQIIYIDKHPYKVMANKDYSRNGYIEYHIIEFYDGE